VNEQGFHHGQYKLMSESTLIPDVSNLVTEDDTPVDNFASAKQQRLLVSSLYSSYQGQTFLAEANVGIFHRTNLPAIVPDVFLSLDVEVPENWWDKQNRSYMVWQFGKPPEVVIEIVSNKVGNELKDKFQIYQQMRVSYYVVYDPTQQLGESVLRIYELRGRRYFETAQTWLEQVNLGLNLWDGEFEDRQDTWLRWCDREGNNLLTGDEGAKLAEQRVQAAEQRNQILAERLRILGVDPDSL
jgi:Uma2 family endonuclease